MVHNGEKHYQCSHYNKFSRSNDLKRHIKVHIGEKHITAVIVTRTFQ